MTKLVVMKENENKGRPFWTCPKADKCKKFLWADIQAAPPIKTKKFPMVPSIASVATHQEERKRPSEPDSYLGSESPLKKGKTEEFESGKEVLLHLVTTINLLQAQMSRQCSKEEELTKELRNIIASIKAADSETSSEECESLEEDDDKKV
jgi:hypothetical protein